MRGLLLHPLRLLLKLLLSLRYRVRVTGLRECAARGDRGVLFLPNHPALIDPVILTTALYPRFRPRPLVNEKQVRASALKYLAGPIRLLCLPDMEIAGKAGRERILRQIDACVDALRSGDNLVFYPAGRIYRCRREDLRGNGGVFRILAAYPEVRIVLVRTKGLWGSEFSRGKGYQISFGECIRRHLWQLLANLVLFMPRRPVDIELVELPGDFPRRADKDTINRCLEAFYNQAETPNLYVPYRWYEPGGIRALPDPDGSRPLDDVSRVPAPVRDQVFARLHACVDRRIIRNLDMLRTDLALDYARIEEICRWLERRFQVRIDHPRNLKTVSSLLLAAAGEQALAQVLRPVDPAWFLPRPSAPAEPAASGGLGECLARAARRSPRHPAIADQTQGTLTARQALRAARALRPALERLPGPRVGICLPAGCPRVLFHFAAALAGKTPVSIPWGMDAARVLACLRQAGCRALVAAPPLAAALEKDARPEGTVLLDGAAALAASRRPLGRLCAALRPLLGRPSVRPAEPVGGAAVVLFCAGASGAGSMAEPSWEVLRGHLRDAAAALGLRQDECLLRVSSGSALFAFAADMLLPFCTPVRVVYPEEGADPRMIPRLVAAYGATALAGDARDLLEILAAADPAQLRTLRRIVVGRGQLGALPQDLVRRRCPGDLVLQEEPPAG